MFPKKKRISRREFSVLFQKSKRINGSFFIAYVLNSDTSRYAVSVSKKIYIKATKRNKLRRQLYHILFNIDKNSHPRSSLVFVVTKRPLGSYALWQKEIESILH